MIKIISVLLIFGIIPLSYSNTPVATYKFSSGINGQTFTLGADYYIMVTRFDYGAGIQFIDQAGWQCINRVYFHGQLDYIRTRENPMESEIKFNYSIDYNVVIKPGAHEEWNSFSSWGIEILGPCIELKFVCAPGCFIELDVYKK